MRERRILTISPAEVMAILQRGESHQQLQQRGLQALGKHVVAQIVPHEGRIELAALQPHRDGRLSQNLQVSVELRPYDRGSMVEFTASTPGTAIAVFLCVLAVILIPVLLASPTIAVAGWGVVALWCGVIAWMARRKVHALNTVLMQVLLEASTAGPYARGAASAA